MDFVVKKRLEKVKNRPERKDNDGDFNLLPPPSPPRPPSLRPQPPRSPLGSPPAPPFFPPPSGRFLKTFQQPAAQPRLPPALKPEGFFAIPPAPSAPPLSPSDYFLLGPSARSVYQHINYLPPTAPPLSTQAFTLSNSLYDSLT